MSLQPNFQTIAFSEYLSLERTLYMAAVTSKKKAIELLAKTIATSIPQLTESTLFENFLQRERLGSTALGKGFALPHCRAKEIDQVVACFLRLKDPIDFDSENKDQIDLIFALVVPHETNELHLKILAYIAEKFSSDKFTSTLRNAKSQEELFKALTNVSA